MDLRILSKIIVFIYNMVKPYNMVNAKCFALKEINTGGNEVLKRDIDGPYQLVIDYNTNILFFSYTFEDSGKSIFKSAHINLENKEFNIIRGIKNGFANTVDQENRIVYLGGEDGIYKFNYKTNRAIHIDGTSRKIWQMFFKNYLYYTTPDEEVYVYKNDQSYRVPELSHTRGSLVAIDNDEHLYFSNSSGLFVVENNTTITYVGDYIINGFTSDFNGNLFFSTPNAIFAIDSKNKSVNALLLKENIYGAAVEYNGNIIYALEDRIGRLKTTKIFC